MARWLKCVEKSWAALFWWCFSIIHVGDHHCVPYHWPYITSAFRWIQAQLGHCRKALQIGGWLWGQSEVGRALHFCWELVFEANERRPQKWMWVGKNQMRKWQKLTKGCVCFHFGRNKLDVGRAIPVDVFCRSDCNLGTVSTTLPHLRHLWHQFNLLHHHDPLGFTWFHHEVTIEQVALEKTL